MKVYLAARYGRRAELCAYAAALRTRGHQVTSRWLDGHHDLAHLEEQADKDQLRAAWAQEDLADVKAADVLVAFTEEPRSGLDGRGGRHCELGAALALRRRVLVVGPRENVFCHLPQVEQYDSWETALAQSKPLQPLRRRKLPAFAGPNAKGKHRRDAQETSIAAAENIGPVISDMQRTIYCWLLAHGPATDHKIHADPLFAPYDQRTPQVRRRELVQMGLVEDSGEKERVGPRNRAILWRAIPPECLDETQRAALGLDAGPSAAPGGGSNDYTDRDDYQQLSFM